MTQSQKKLFVSGAVFLVAIGLFQMLAFDPGYERPLSLFCPYWTLIILLANVSEGTALFLAVPMVIAQVFTYFEIIRRGRRHGKLALALTGLSLLHLCIVAIVYFLAISTWSRPM